MRHLLTAIFLLFSVLEFDVYGQADRKVENQESVLDDVTFYEQMIAQKTADLETYLQLAEAYFLLEDYENAIPNYAHYLASQEFSLPQTYYKYSKALELDRQFVKAVAMYKTAERLNHNMLSSSSCADRNGIHMLSENFLITEFEWNSAESDFAPAFYRDRLVFSSNRANKGKTKNSIDPWTGKPYRNLYLSETMGQGKHTSPSPFVIDQVKGLRGTTTVFTNDGRTLYFTKEVRLDRKRGGNTSVLKIYKASLQHGKWKSIEELPFNGTDFSTAHPALNNEETQLYFASDRAGRRGVSDLYVVDIYDGGKAYGDPVKLGPEINTDGKDTFPYISKSGKLYFSSDGHPGLGGMDVFMTDLNVAKHQEVKVYNLGAPINSSLDDFGLIVDENTRSGYFCSNRRKGPGKDDIFSFTLQDDLSLSQE